MRCLEIGPGSDRIPGFERMDLRPAPGIDHVGDARVPPFPGETFDLVYSSHTIEHIEWYDVEDTIAQWARILKRGGTMEVFTVDAYKLMKAIITLEDTGKWTGATPGQWKHDLTRREPYKWAVGRLMNYAKKGSAGTAWMHRAIITPGYLRRCMDQAGLVGIEALTLDDVRGNKSHGWINFGLKGKKP